MLQEDEIMQFLDEKFWLAISFLIFIYFAYKPVKKAILASLDAKILAIKEQVLEAEKLKNDANLLFEKTSKQLGQISNLRDQMLKDGQESTNKLIDERNNEIEAFLERKKIETLSLIDNQKIQACQLVQSQFCDKIIELVTVYFQSAQKNSLLDTEIAKKLIDRNNIPK